MSLGLPDINITFKENATTFVQRSKKGTIAMILKGEHEEETARQRFARPAQDARHGA